MKATAGIDMSGREGEMEGYDARGHGFEGYWGEEDGVDGACGYEAVHERLDVGTRYLLGSYVPCHLGLNFCHLSHDAVFQWCGGFGHDQR